MWLRTVCTVLCIYVANGNTRSNDIGYYWKDYYGTIPADAFVAGKTLDGQNTYAGQVIRMWENDSKGTGIVPVQIFPGVKSVTTYYGDRVQTYNKHIKILCGNQENFKWLTTTSDTINKDLIGKEVVHGGFLYYLNFIGRVLDNGGETRIGSVEPHGNKPRRMYPVIGQTYENVMNYEVLIYEKNQNEDLYSYSDCE